MHMSDALMSPAVAATMYTATAAVTTYSVRKINKRKNQKIVPVMGVMGAFVFAAQMINFTIPGTGSSGHITGAFLLAAILGPEAAFLTMIGVLGIQALMFADGGLLALGANIWNMSFYGCFISYYLIYRPLMKNGISNRKLLIASLLGCMLSLEAGAFTVTIQTSLSNITELPFGIFVSAMMPIHLAIGLIEGLVTQAVLVFINSKRPELLEMNQKTENEFSFHKTALVMVISTLIVAGGLSLAASSLPDGLEYSIQNVSAQEELENPDNDIYAVSDSIQKTTSLLPDYENTSFSGIAGVSIILLISAAAAVIIREKGVLSTNE